MLVERKLPLLLQIGAQRHQIQVPCDYTPRDLITFIYNTYPEVLPFLLDFHTRLLIGRLDVMTQPTKALKYLANAPGARVVVDVQFEPIANDPECSSVVQTGRHVPDELQLSAIVPDEQPSGGERESLPSLLFDDADIHQQSASPTDELEAWPLLTGTQF